MPSKNQGGRGVTPSPNALRRRGWRPTAIHPRFKKLVDAIAAARNWPKSTVVEQALEQLATDEEREAARFEQTLED